MSGVWKPASAVSARSRASAYRDVPLAPQLVSRLREHRREMPPVGEEVWVFHTGAGTPFGHRNVETRALNSAAALAGLDDGAWPRLRFHDLRHTFASHLIVDLRLDVAQVSRILREPAVPLRESGPRRVGVSGLRYAQRRRRHAPRGSWSSPEFR
jgi:integrase